MSASARPLRSVSEVAGTSFLRFLTSEAPASRSSRIAVAAVAGAIALVLGMISMIRRGQSADFLYWWLAGRVLVSGENPYRGIGPGTAYPLEGPFLYPMPAALVGALFSPLDHVFGAALFIALGFALAAYGLSSFGGWRVLVLLSTPAIWVFENAQWIPLLVGATLVPWMGWLLACKPTMGAALFAWRPDWRIIVGSALVTLVALAVQPSWPGDWITSVQGYPAGDQYRSPLGVPGGVLLLLVLLRWRRPESRLLLVMASIPQNYFFYDQLPLMLIPQRRQSLLRFVIWSHALRVLAEFTIDTSVPGWTTDVAMRSAALEPFIIWGLYIPAALMVLRRPNEGHVPAWLDRWLAHPRIPTWVRGKPETA